MHLMLTAYPAATFACSLALMKVTTGSLDGFYKARWLHALHAVVTSVLTLAGCHATAMSFSMAYFTIDLPASVSKRDIPFTLHALLALSLIIFGSEDNLFAKGLPNMLLVELSTPLYHMWKVDKKRSTFGCFVVVFFFCRILLVPYLSLRLICESSVVCLLVTALYILNVIWFRRILEMYHSYEGPSGSFNVCFLSLLPLGYLLVTRRSFIGIPLLLNFDLLRTRNWKATCSGYNLWACWYITCSCPAAIPPLLVGVAIWLSGSCSGSQVLHVIAVQTFLLFGLAVYL